jgi:hypothetical protein
MAQAHARGSKQMVLAFFDKKGMKYCTVHQLCPKGRDSQHQLYHQGPVHLSEGFEGGDA